MTKFLNQNPPILGSFGCTLQSSLILSSALYSVYYYLQIIKKMKIIFFQCGHPHLAEPLPLMSAAPPPLPPRRHPLLIALNEKDIEDKAIPNLEVAVLR